MRRRSTTSGPMTTFCPMVTFRPILTPPRMWLKCQIYVPSPISTRPIDIDRLVDLHARIGLRHAARGQGRDGGRRRLAALASCSASLARVSTRSTRSPSRPSVRGARAGRDAIEEMLALAAAAAPPARARSAPAPPSRAPAYVLPLDLVRIEQELSLPWLAVIEHRHGVGADDDELLLLKRVQP